jgi:hypothetical protein
MGDGMGGAEFIDTSPKSPRAVCGGDAFRFPERTRVGVDGRLRVSAD